MPSRRIENDVADILHGERFGTYWIGGDRFGKKYDLARTDQVGTFVQQGVFYSH